MDTTERFLVLQHQLGVAIVVHMTVCDEVPYVHDCWEVVGESIVKNLYIRLGKMIHSL